MTIFFKCARLVVIGSMMGVTLWGCVLPPPRIHEDEPCEQHESHRAIRHLWLTARPRDPDALPASESPVSA